MNYILEPLNENQDMNCMVKFQGNRTTACAKASNIAATLQAVLKGCSITCRVRKAAVNSSNYTNERGGIIADASGNFFSEETGKPIKL